MTTLGQCEAKRTIVCDILAADSPNRDTRSLEGFRHTLKDDEATHEARIYLKPTVEFYQRAIRTTETTHGIVNGELLIQVS